MVTKNIASDKALFSTEKILIFFLISPQKCMLWVFIRSAFLSGAKQTCNFMFYYVSSQGAGHC